MLTKVEERLKQLVAFQSTTDNQKEVAALLDFVQRQLAEVPLHSKRYVSNGIESLVMTSQNTKSPKLWLVAHVDVVKASADMFTMKAEGDKLYGRGVVDDKFAVAAFIEAAVQLGSKVQDYNFGIMLTGDEETGGADGVGYLVEQEGYQSEVAFVPDGGLGWEIETQAKGALRFLLKAKGVSAHGSRPWLGENAIEKVLSAVDRIRERLAIPELTTAAQGYTRTLNLGVIKGGEAANQVPEAAEAQIDIRYVEPNETEEIRRLVNEEVQKFEQLSCQETAYITPVKTDKNEPWIQKFASILESEGITPAYMRSFGGTDARYFTEKGIPVIVSQPPGGSLHAVDEWIDRKGLEQLVTVTTKLILESK